MNGSDLIFVDRDSDWIASRASVRFRGECGGERFQFLASDEAICSAANLPTEPSGAGAIEVFERHRGIFVALAHKLWEQNRRAQADYMITAEMVETHRQ